MVLMEARLDEPVRFTTKLAVVLREDLQPWQRLNATAFLVSGIGTASPDVIGEPYRDADGTEYLPMFRQPVMVFEANSAELTAVKERALSRAMLMSVFTEDLFVTNNDRDNRAAIAAVAQADLNLIGVALYGAKNPVDKTLKGLRKHA